MQRETIIATIEKKTGSGERKVNKKSSKIIKSVKVLIKEIDSLLQKKEYVNPKPVKDKPDTDTLKKLMEACKIFSMDMVDEIMLEINQFQYDSDNGLAVWLQENVEQMNFDLIIKKLSED